MSLVVDDHLLLDLLLGAPTDWLLEQSTNEVVYTTGSWYYRVALAAKRGTGTGTISSRIAGLDAASQERIFGLVSRLPEWVGLLDQRLLIPVMANLGTRITPNLLAVDALGVALVTDSTIVVSTDSPLIRRCALELGIPYRVELS